MATFDQTLEKAYQRGLGAVQLRTAAGRYIRGDQHVEAVEHHVYEGRGRLICIRTVQFGRPCWLVRQHGPY